MEFRRKYGSPAEFGGFLFEMYLVHIDVAATWQTDQEWRKIVHILRSSKAQNPQVDPSDKRIQLVRYDCCLIYNYYLNVNNGVIAGNSRPSPVFATT